MKIWHDWLIAMQSCKTRKKEGIKMLAQNSESINDASATVYKLTKEEYPNCAI